MKHPLTLLTALLLAPLAALHAAETSSQPAQPDVERALLQGFAHPPVQFAPGPQYGPDKRNYQGIPTIARAPQGRLWAAWYAGKIWEDKYNYVLAATSGDDGKTWSAPQLVIDPDGDGDRRASDPCFWLDPGGKLWLFWWMNGGGLNVTLAITTENPNDEHPVWTKPRALFPGVMLNKPTVLKSGDWLMPAAIWNRDESARVMITKDGGKTFSLLGAANIPAERRNADEHMIVERKDGSLMMLVRTDKHGIGRSLSRDGGRTWTGVEDYLPHATSRFFLRRLASGNLLLVKHGPIDKRIDRSELTAYLSEDDGETWKGGLLIDPRKNVSYPDGIQAPDGRIDLIYDWERARDKNILMATFTESDVLARAFSPGGRERVLINHATGVNLKITVKPVPVDLTKRTWQGIPGLERTAKGRVFVSWFTGGTKEPEPLNTVVLSHSDDGGKTFSAPQAMGLPLSDGTRCYDPCLWIDPKGRLWYLFNRSVKDSTRHGVYARICDAPDAAPPVWGAEFRVGFDSPFSFRMNKPVVLSTGEWIMPVTHALEPVAAWAGFDPKQVQGVGISTDEGKTWTLHGAVKMPGASLENMIVELRDGRLWMLIRTAKVLWESHSSDKGRTWTEGRPTTIATPHSRFFIRRLASGNLLLVNHYKFIGRSHLTAQLSTDDGKTWNDGLVLDERGGPNFPNGVPGGVSYPDGVQDKDGLIWITYDRNRNGLGEILLAKFKEEDVAAGKDVSGAVSLKQVVNKLDKPSLLPANWDPALAGDIVMQRLVKVTAPQVKGAHDAEFVCVGDHAYIVASANDVQPGENPEWPFMYVTMSIMNLKSLKPEKVIDFAKSEQAFENQTLPAGACIVPRIIRKDAGLLRCYFDSNNPGERQSQVWYRDFDLGRNEFAPTIHKAKLKTAAGTFDFQPQYLHADAAAQGFTRVANDSTIHIFDSFKRFDGRIYVALNNFRGKQNALALVHDDLETFEVLGHFNQPESAALSESAVNRLPDGTWMAVVRSDIPVRDGGNYHFATSRDGRTWTAGRQMPHVPNGLNSKPTFEKFGGLYYLGWQEATSILGANRSVFNVDVSRDGKTWERKYRFETPHSFQYPTFHEHEGAIWLCVTQGDTDPSRKERIMFGKLEAVGDFERQNGQTKRIAWPISSPPTELPASIRPSPPWTAQAAKDAKQDFTSIPFDGISPNKLACDTTLREMPDGSWVMVMLGGGDTEPRPENHVLLTRSHDKGKTWSAMQPLDFGFPREGDTIAMVPSELMVYAGRCTLFFATHDGKFAGWKEWMTHSKDSCRTWSKPEPAPGRLHERTFIRNHIVARDGRILLPFQHYLDAPSCRNPRNGVLISADGGKTWTEHGNIRISKDDNYRGWAENNIVELIDGHIAMIIRADRLGGVLFYAESKDGGKTWPEFAAKSDIPNPGSKATLHPLGGDTVALLHNPNPKGRHPLALWISFDGMNTWPYQRVLVEHSSDGPGRSLNYPDGFVSKDKQWLHFAYDDNRHRAVHYSAKLPPLPAPKAADASKPTPPVKVTQQLLNSIHVTPKLIFDPFPAYAEKYLPFAMAASMESTSKGRLWTCWAGGQDGPNAYLLASYSDDQGKSWRDPVFVIDPQAQGLKMGTRLGSFWCDPKGRLWLFFHQSVGMFDGSCSNWFVRCDDPDAEKPVWTEPVYIDFGASLNKPIVRKNGEWILPVSLWERWHIDKPFADCYRELDPVRGANVFVSDDEGDHWRYRGGIIYKDSCFNEHSVVEKQDGTLWMLSRGMKATFQSFSDDGGKTWKPQSTAFPHVNSKAVIRRLQSGNLLVIRHGQDITKATPARQELTAFLTTDEGKTWSGKLLLDERTGVSYPDIAQAPNGDIYVHYDRNRASDAEILFARFREEDVQAGKLVSKGARLKNVVKSKAHGMSRGGANAAAPKETK